MPWQLYPQERDPVPIVQEAALVSGPVWTGAENLALAGICSLDSPACSNLLRWEVLKMRQYRRSGMILLCPSVKSVHLP
jgi:hypothetical protein